MGMDIYLLHECKKLLIKSIEKFLDCWFHNTPYYTAIESVIRAYLSIVVAHKNRFKLCWIQRWILIWYRSEEAYQKSTQVKVYLTADMRSTYDKDKILNPTPF